MKLPRAPGRARAALGALLCGPVDVVGDAGGGSDTEDFVAASELAALKAQQAALQSRSGGELRALVERLYAELGVDRELNDESDACAFDLPEQKKLTLRDGDPDPLGRHGRDGPCQQHDLLPLLRDRSASSGSHRAAGAPDPEGEGPVIVNAFCNFIRQLEYPGDVLARHYVANPGRTSFDTYMTLERTDQPGVIYADGRRARRCGSTSRSRSRCRCPIGCAN